MQVVKANALTFLSEHELAQIHGSGGQLDIALKGMPVQGSLTFTHGTPKGSISGTLTTNGSTWQGGFSTSLKVAKGVRVGTSFSTQGKNWEVGVSASIRF
jgi:hypothetical protein